MIRFTLFGVAVSIQPTALLVLAGLGWYFAGDGVAVALSICLFTVAAFICLLSHEMGHALVGRRLGGGHPQVDVSWLGGDCCNAEAVFTRLQGVVMTAAGPLATLVEAALAAAYLCWLCGDVQEGIHTAGCALIGCVTPEFWAQHAQVSALFAVYMVQIGFWWSVLNLLPIFPLDGGQIMHGLMSSPRTMHLISLFTALPAFVLCLTLGLWMLALFLGLLAYLNYKCLWFTTH